jgi:hypothetical protein
MVTSPLVGSQLQGKLYPRRKVDVSHQIIDFSGAVIKDELYQDMGLDLPFSLTCRVLKFSVLSHHFRLKTARHHAMAASYIRKCYEDSLTEDALSFW